MRIYQLVVKEKKEKKKVLPPNISQKLKLKNLLHDEKAMT